MIRKVRFLVLFLILHSFCVNGQNTDSKRFKRRYALSSNFGIAIPTSNFDNKNNLGTNLGVVLEADLKAHLFTRFSWDVTQFNYLVQNEIGGKLVDIKAKNNGNAFYFSLGYYKNIANWRFYSFAGIGFATLSDPKLTTLLIGNANYAYLSNQNSSSLTANYGIGAGYRLSPNERIMIESSFMQMPDIVDNATYFSINLVYRVFFTEPK
jgi:hypothetical protein